MTAPILYAKDSDDIVTLTFNSEGQRVNTLNDEMRDCLIETIERVVKEKDSIAGVIFASAKSTFFAGGDLNYLYQLKAEDADQLFDQISTVKRAFRQLETLGKPVVAAINGSAVGGGFELALACHYRICINEAKTQLGLPEASLGLLPGLGGVVRMNLLLGLINSQTYLQEGKLFNPAHAYEQGLVHALVNDQVELLNAAREWILSRPHALQPWDQPDYNVPGGRPGDFELDRWIATAMDQLIARTKGCYPAPEAILSCSIEGMKLSFDQADLIETQAFIGLVTGSVAKNLMGTFWFQLNSLRAGGALPKPISPKDFNERVYDAFVQEGLAMLDAGQDPATIESGALAAGFLAGPLAGLDQASLIRAFPQPQPQCAEHEVKDRLLFCMALESVRLFQQEAIAAVSLGNVGSVMELGFPRWTGGVFQFLNQYGLSQAVDRSLELARQYGEQFSAPDLLVEKVRQGGQF